MAVMASTPTMKMPPPMRKVQKREVHRSFSNSWLFLGNSAQSWLAASWWKMERIEA